MNRRRRPRRAAGQTPDRPATTARVNVTPMIDVVMVLIVFFLLVGHLANERRGLVDLPFASEGEDEDGTRRPVVVLVRAVDDVRVNGVTVPREGLAESIATGVAANARIGRDGGVHVRADAGISYSAVRPVLNACRDAGVGEVKLAVRPEWTR